MIHIGLVFILNFKCARSARRQQMITWEKWRRRISAVKLRFLNLIVWQLSFSWTLVKFFLNRWSQSSLEKLHMLWNMKRPLWQLLPFNLLHLNLISSLALLVVNCPLGLRFLDTLSIYKNKRFKPVIALWISLFDQIEHQTKTISWVGVGERALCLLASL